MENENKVKAKWMRRTRATYALQIYTRKCMQDVMRCAKASQDHQRERPKYKTYKMREKREIKEPPVAQRFSHETLFWDPLTISLYIVTILFILLSLWQGSISSRLEF